MNEDVFPTKTGGFPASYVSLPEGSSPWCGPTCPVGVVWGDPLKAKRQTFRKGRRSPRFCLQKHQTIGLMLQKSGDDHQLRQVKLLETRGYFNRMSWWSPDFWSIRSGEVFAELHGWPCLQQILLAFSILGNAGNEKASKGVETKLLWHSIPKTCLGK